jgi:hypothetical protein
MLISVLFKRNKSVTDIADPSVKELDINAMRRADYRRITRGRPGLALPVVKSTLPLRNCANQGRTSKPVKLYSTCWAVREKPSNNSALKIIPCRHRDNPANPNLNCSRTARTRSVKIFD